MKVSYIGHELIYGAPVLAYAGLIFVLSSSTALTHVIPSVFGFDKLAHFCEYYIFGFLIHRWLRAKRSGFADRYAAHLTVVIGTLYGLSDEWHQSFVPGRHATLWDVLFDGLGVVTAALSYPAIIKRIPFFAVNPPQGLSPRFVAGKGDKNGRCFSKKG